MEVVGGDGGIRTLDTLLGYAHLANECLQPLGHVSRRMVQDWILLRRWRNRREWGSFVKDENRADRVRRSTRTGWRERGSPARCRTGRRETISGTSHALRRIPPRSPHPTSNRAH